MSRFIAMALAFIGFVAPAIAQTPAAQVATPTNPAADAPEKLLSPTSQLYLRWDGITAHNNAYKKSMWGGLMAGPTGNSIRAMLAEVPKLLGNSQLVEPLLEGKPVEELKSALADFKNATQIIDLIADKGAILGFEVREPSLTLKGVGQALGGLFKGEMPGPEKLAPDVQLFVIVPDSAQRAEVLFATFRQLLAKSDSKIEPFAVAERKGFRIAQPDGADSASSTSIAWWLEGKHFVFYVGTVKLDATLNSMAANAKKGGITGHPLFQQCIKSPGYESITRGFVDTERLISLVKMLAGPFVPGLGQRIDDVGIGGLKSIVFNSGFDGKESRATYEFNVPGERKGLAKILKPEPLSLKDLPPFPPDMTRFSALRIDPTVAYEAAITTIEALNMNSPFDVEDDAKSLQETIRLRREYLMKEADKQLGMNIKKDLLAHLGDKLVIYDTPSEGLSTLGTVVCISLKDPARFKLATDRLQRGLEALVGSPVKVRKKTLCGVEIRELYSPAFLIFTPTYAIAGDWLVFSVHPQPVQGFVLRAKGELPSWKPDAATMARLAKLPADACGLQFCDPRATVRNLCCIGPLAFNVLSYALSASRSDNESAYEPLDIGLLPNAHELSKHLFPNLTATRDDGKTIRIEVSESFSLPLEFIGLESLVVTGGFLGYVGALGGF